MPNDQSAKPDISYFRVPVGPVGLPVQPSPTFPVHPAVENATNTLLEINKQLAASNIPAANGVAAISALRTLRDHLSELPDPDALLQSQLTSLGGQVDSGAAAAFLGRLKAAGGVVAYLNSQVELGDVAGGARPPTVGGVHVYSELKITKRCAVAIGVVIGGLVMCANPASVAGGVQVVASGLLGAAALC